jgi:hypothetical protein
MKSHVLPSYVVLLSTAAALLLAGARCDADVLLKYQMGQLNPQIQDPVNTVAGDILLPGAGLNLFSYTSTIGYPTAPSLAITFNGAYTNLDMALSNSSWFTFDVTVGSGVTNLNLTSLTFLAARGGGATPRGYGVYVTTPTKADEQLKGATDLTTQRTTWGLPQQVPLSGFASLQGLTSGQVISFKIALYSPTNDSSIDFDDITLNGYANLTTNEAPILPLAITDIKYRGNAVDLTWLSNTGKVYSVQYATALAATNVIWQDFTTGIAAAPGTNRTTASLDLTGSSATNAVLLQYRMGTAAAQVQNATNTAAGGDLAPGAGLNLWAPNSALGYSTAPVLSLNFKVAGTDLAAAIANANQFTFSLTAGSNVTDLDLTSLTFNAARGGSGTPRGYGVFVTTPTTTSEQVQAATDLATARPAWSPQSISLTNASLQNLTAGQVVTFTIPCYSPAAGSSLEFDDITVSGNVTPAIPQPYTGAKQLFFRIVTPVTY